MTRPGRARGRPLVPAALLLVLLTAGGAPGQAIPPLPDGGRARWVVEGAEEIVGWLLFDPATVAHRLPAGLRFVTVGDIAARGLPWATEHLRATPGHRDWAVSFIEIVRAATFTIDGRSPDWPEAGGVALWFARVAASEPGADPGPGRDYLELGFWVPDRAFVAYMTERGYHARYGRVRLEAGADGAWRGSLTVPGVRATAQCTPSGPTTGGPGSAGRQVFHPPTDAQAAATVAVAFAGHRIRRCREDRVWTFRGTHPLASAVAVGASTFQYGFHLVGAVYPAGYPP